MRNGRVSNGERQIRWIDEEFSQLAHYQKVLTYVVEVTLLLLLLETLGLAQFGSVLTYTMQELGWYGALVALIPAHQFAVRLQEGRYVRYGFWRAFMGCLIITDLTLLDQVTIAYTQVQMPVFLDLTVVNSLRWVVQSTLLVVMV